MLGLNIEIERRRLFWKSNEELSLRAEFESQNSDRAEISAPVFSKLIYLLLQNAPELIPNTFKYSANHTDSSFPSSFPVVKNVRGRPPETFDSNSTASKLQAQKKEELFFASGEILDIPEMPLHPSSKTVTEKHPFEFQLQTKFLTFENSKIIHQLITQQSGFSDEFARILNAPLLFELAPIAPMVVRLGSENFHTRLIGSMIGLSPKVESRLFLELSCNKLLFAMTEEVPRGGNFGALRCCCCSLTAFSSALEQTELYRGFSDTLKELLAQDKARKLVWNSAVG